ALPILIFRIGGRAAGSALDQDDVRRKRREQKGIDEAENGGVGADAQGQTSRGGGREARVPPHVAYGVAHVLAQGGHPGERGFVAARLLGASHATEALQRLAPSLVRGRPGAGLLASSHPEVKPALPFP